MQPHSMNEVDSTVDGSDRAAMMLPRLIVIGGAQGSTDAARRILKGLPSTLPAAVIVVMHAMPGEQGDGSDGLAGERFPLPTRIATAGHRIAAGEVLSTPTGCHVQVVEGGTIEIDGPKLVCTSRSAVDMLFESAATTAPTGRAASRRAAASPWCRARQAQVVGMPMAAILGDHPDHCPLI